LAISLLNLVRGDAESTIEEDFGKNLIQTPERQFKRTTWEEINTFVFGRKNQRSDILRKYMGNKTVGYKAGLLCKAFAIPS